MEKTGSKPIDELVRRAIIGDARAFTQLWDTNIDALRAYLKTTMRQLDDFFVDDICSRSFEKAFRQIGSYDCRRSQFGTWLRKIAHNTALDMIQSEARTNRPLVSLDEGAGEVTEETDSPLEAIIKDECQLSTEKLIEGLPAIYREIARRRFVEGMQYKEIADEMGMELNTVRTRIRRAKSQMDKMKKNDEETDD